MKEYIEERAKGLGLTTRQIHTEVEGFLNAQNEKMCLDALDLLERGKRKNDKEGIHVGSTLRLWRWATKQIMIEKHRVAKESRLRAEQDQARRKYQESIQKGYVPDRETLKAQLDDLLDKGEISLQEYEWGIKGLETVYGLVEIVQQEQDIPF